MIGGVVRQLAITAACASAGCSLLVSDGGPPDDGVPTCAVTAFSAAGNGACLINADGELYCWGHSLVNASGEDRDELIPARVSGLEDVRDVHVAEFHACAVHGDDGQVSCWGRNDAGQVGDGTSGDIRSTPTLVVGITDAVMVRTGQFHSCAVYGSERRVRCWGDNQSGQLGDGTFEPRLDAIGDDVSMLSGVVDLTVGDAVTCAVKQDHTAVCWGANGSGELGADSTDPERTTPGQIADLVDVEEIAAGCHQHLCAIDRDALVWCWGDNEFGQVGRAGAAAFLGPQAVIPSEDFTAQHVAVGGLHTCALHSSGYVYCWGQTGSSQLGFETPEEEFHTLPGEVMGLPLDSATVDVEAGCFQSCARRQDGSIWCWGSNLHGELGDGTTEPRIEPRPVQYECQ